MVNPSRGGGLLFLFLLGVLCSVRVWAQASAPATLEQLRQQERERELRQQQVPAPDVRLPREAARPEALDIPTNETPCFPIRHVEMAGELAETFAPSFLRALEMMHLEADQCLGARGIHVVMARVQNEIIAAGYVTTRLLVTPQDLKSGVLVLTVVPGRVRAIRFSAEPPARVSLAAAVPVRPGDLLNLRDIEQGLENLKRPPGAEADIRIEPASAEGAAPGQSDLVIDYRPPALARLTLSADDGGAKATGKHQGGLTLSLDNPLGLSDLFYLNLSRDLGNGSGHRRGTRGTNLHYSVPHGYWLASVNAGQMRYHQSVPGINQTYRYSGESRQAELALSRLIHRDAVRKTTVTLSTWLRSSRNYIDDVEIGIQRRRMAGWQTALGHREFLGAAILDARLAWRQGTGAWGALHAPEEVSGEGTARSRLVSADATLNLPFALAGARLRYSGTWRAQWNRTALVPQDRFSIGGRYTVRGFDGESILLAERGWLVRNDLGLALGASRHELYLGLDHGEVGGASADLLVGRRLTGAVLGLRGVLDEIAGSLNYDFFIGEPLRKPKHFKTARTTAGFNLVWSF